MFKDSSENVSMQGSQSAKNLGDLDQGVTVVVPTLNRDVFLRDCLLDLVAQQHRPLEILVVDQSDKLDPQIQELCERWPDIINYQRVTFRGVAQARNYGWQQARYEAIVFVDDDVRCGPMLVKEHLKALMRPGVGIVAGAVDNADGHLDPGPPTGKFSSWTATPTRGFGASGEFEVEHAPGGNFSMWRDVLAEVGGFDERLTVGAALYEETDFCLRARRAGHRIWFNGNARVLYRGAPYGGNRVSLYKYIYGLAHNRAIIIRRHISAMKRPVALGRLFSLVSAYALHYRSPRLFEAALLGMLRGWPKGRQRPLCTEWR